MPFRFLENLKRTPVFDKAGVLVYLIFQHWLTICLFVLILPGDQLSRNKIIENLISQIPGNGYFMLAYLKGIAFYGLYMLCVNDVGTVRLHKPI